MDGGVNIDRFVDGEVQCIHVRTIPNGYLVCIGVDAGFRVKHIVPFIFFAGLNIEALVRAVIDGQVQGIHARTTLFVGVFIKESAT